MSSPLTLLHTPPARAGKLKKAASSKGEDVFRGGWTERYFKLYQGRLEYYKHADDNSPAGEIDLRAALIDPVEPTFTDGAPHCIRIAEAKQIFYYLQTPTTLERDAWLRDLRVCAGIDESLSDTLAAAAAVSITDRSVNFSAWSVLQQCLDERDDDPPELFNLVLGADGNLRLYNQEARLWRQYDLTQIVDIKSTEKADSGCGIGPSWRMLVCVSVKIKLHPTTSGGAAPGESRLNWYLATEEEARIFVPLLRAAAKNDLSALQAYARAPTRMQTSVEVYDASYRTGWSAKYVVLTQCRAGENKLLLMKNSNDPSVWRALHVAVAKDPKAQFNVTPEGELGVTVSSTLEREGEITLKFSTPKQREDYYLALMALVEIQEEVERKIAEKKRLQAAEEKARIDAERARLAKARPLTAAELASAAASAGQEVRTASGSTAKRLSLEDISAAWDGASSGGAAKPGTSESAPSAGADDSLDARLDNATPGQDTLFAFPHPLPARLLPKDETHLLAIGAAERGQTGCRASGADALTPAVVDVIKAKRVRSVAAGRSHALTLTQDGHVYAFGSSVQTSADGKESNSGCLGVGERMSEARVPLLLSSLLRFPIAHVACGAAHSLAITRDGKLLAWGLNERGQTGIARPAGGAAAASTAVIHTPTVVTALDGWTVHAASAGAEHSAVIATPPASSDPTVSASAARRPQLFTFGRGSTGCLGQGRDHDEPSPRQVNTLALGAAPAAVACGAEFTLVALSDGSLLSAGRNDSGQLGLGDTNARSLFVRVSRLKEEAVRVFAVAAGATHAACLALDIDGETGVWAWGAGVLNGFREPQLHPIPAATVRGARTVSAAASHTVVATSAGRAFAWGLNQRGELGNGAAGVQALVKMKLAATSTGQTAEVVQTAAGGGFTLLLVRGQPAEAASAGVASAASAAERSKKLTALAYAGPASNAAAASTALPSASGLATDVDENEFLVLRPRGRVGSKVVAKTSAAAEANSAADSAGAAALARILGLSVPEGDEQAAGEGILSGSSDDLAMAAITKLLQVEAAKEDDERGTKTTVIPAETEIHKLNSSAPARPTKSSPSLPAVPAVAAEATVTAKMAPAAPITPEAKPFVFTPAATAAVPLPNPPQTTNTAAAATTQPRPPSLHSTSASADPPAVATGAAPGSVAARIAAIKAAAGKGGPPASPPAAASVPVPTASSAGSAQPVRPSEHHQSSPSPSSSPAPSASIPSAAVSPAAPPAATAVSSAAAPIASSSALASASAAVAPAATSKVEVRAADSKPEKPLPPNWKRVLDAASGRHYYYNKVTRETSWKRPKIQPASAEDIPPPPPPE